MRPGCCLQGALHQPDVVISQDELTPATTICSRSPLLSNFQDRSPGGGKPDILAQTQVLCCFAVANECSAPVQGDTGPEGPAGQDGSALGLRLARLLQNESLQRPALRLLAMGDADRGGRPETTPHFWKRVCDPRPLRVLPLQCKPGACPDALRSESASAGPALPSHGGACGSLGAELSVRLSEVSHSGSQRQTSVCQLHSWTPSCCGAWCCARRHGTLSPESRHALCPPDEPMAAEAGGELGWDRCPAWEGRGGPVDVCLQRGRPSKERAA